MQRSLGRVSWSLYLAPLSTLTSSLPGELHCGILAIFSAKFNGGIPKHSDNPFQMIASIVDNKAKGHCSG